MSIKKRLFSIVLVFCITLPMVAMAASWKCPNCNNDATGNFCNNCGTAYVSTSDTTDFKQATDEGDLYPVYLVYDCSENLFFSTYNVDLYLNGDKIETLKHGEEETFVVNLPKGNHELMVTQEGDRSVYGDLTLNVTGSLRVNLSISCYSDHLNFKQGSVEVLPYLTPAEQAVRDALEEKIPQATAQKVVVVAMTNCQATDVFNKDGTTYNTAKFHSYDDIDGFYLYVIDEGNWTAKDEQTWHVTDMKCMMSGYDTLLKVCSDISFDGTNYVVSNVDKMIATEEYIDSGNTAKVNTEHLEPAKTNPFLTVKPELVKKDRDSAAERARNNRTMPTEERKAWISNQFHWWSSAHTGLEDLVKDALNDERSYDHKKTEYIDIVNESKQTLVNDTLKKLGSSYRVEIGDLFIMLEFSAKNVFNATIKSTAYGIVRYSDNTVTLIHIE